MRTTRDRFDNHPAPRLSELLRHAVVADLVMQGEEIDLRPEALRSKRDRFTLNAQQEWLDDFARQLGMRYVGAATETLWFILRELERHCRPWPPATDQRLLLAIVEPAVQGLSAPEMLGTLLSGPPSWGAKKIEEPCKVGKLAGRLRPLLVRSLTSSLAHVLDQWIAWDVPRLREMAVENQKALGSAESSQLVKTRVSGPRTTPPRKSPEERRKAREGLGYTPPGRI